MKTGIELIAQEGKEQIEKHRRSIDNDVLLNNDGQLHLAALNLLSIKDGDIDGLNDALIKLIPKGWSRDIWTKMCSKNDYERKIIAGALIAAEIDRLQNS